MASPVSGKSHCSKSPDGKHKGVMEDGALVCCHCGSGIIAEPLETRKEEAERK